MAHLFLIAGHGAGDSGAVGNGYTEAERVRTLAKKIAELGGGNVTLADINRNWYADKGISSLNIPKDWQIGELHMDSEGAAARGGHIIIKDGVAADGYDNALASFISTMFPGRAQSIVPRADLANANRAYRKGYGYRLVECGFITSSADIKIFNEQLDDLAKGILSAFGIHTEPSYGLGEPVFKKNKETLDIGFNFSLPTKEGRFKWLLYDLQKQEWSTLVEWTASNWITLAIDKAQYLVQCQLYDLNSKLVDTKTIGTDAGTGTIITGTYAGWRGKEILIGCTSNNQDTKIKMKLYNTKTKQWFTQFSGQWASFTPDTDTHYVVRYEAYKDGRLLDYRAVGI